TGADRPLTINGMRILFAIPHFFGNDDTADGRAHGSRQADPRPRVAALTACLAALHESFGRVQCIIDVSRRAADPLPRNDQAVLDVVICTTGGRPVRADLAIDSRLYQHQGTSAEPLHLGFECHRVLGELLDRYDYYCYLEDDLILEDPWFF